MVEEALRAQPRQMLRRRALPETLPPKAVAVAVVVVVVVAMPRSAGRLPARELAP